MSTKQKITYVFGLFLLMICITGVVVLTSFNSAKQKNLPCPAVEISIDHENGIFFLEESDITSMLVKQFGDSVTGDNIKTIQLSRIENIIETNAFVKDAETFLDMQGTLHINIIQKEPIARIINKYGVNYYITENRNKFPLNNKFTCRVPVITGHIEEGLGNADTLATKTVQDIFKLIQFIRKNELWNAQTEQVYVNENNQFEIIPKIGAHTILFGNIENMEKKFENLETFYTEGLNYVGWEKYKTINVSILNQIICTKKDT
ncbi:MAG: hypothetical protein H7X71_01045 [Chitinophagales bacterium]|nr:hypothetical protein [Chitinophagales bacterium]